MQLKKEKKIQIVKKVALVKKHRIHFNQKKLVIIEILIFLWIC